MSEPTEHEVSTALAAAPPIVLAAGPRAVPAQAPPAPDDTWQLPGGIAWVYYGERNQGLVRPVIMADGFNTGPSTLAFSWAVLETSGFPLISELRRRGRDVVLLGFTERSASILANAEAAMAAIMQTTAQQIGDRPLTVGGFSMGGLVTRYALAALESQHQFNHRTRLYFSYDSPHNGAYIPLSLQAFAHYIRKLDPRFSDQMNSPAAQQLLWRHIANWSDKPGVSPLRTEFLDELQRVGNWPRIPQLLALANGVDTGVGNGIPPGATAVKGKGLGITGTDLRTMPIDDNALAAVLRVITLQKNEVRAEGLPAIDGAPGGTLDSFAILAAALNKVIGLGVDNPITEHCFVPSVSAVAVRGLDTNDDLYTNIADLDPEESEFDEFICASRNEPHTTISQELCEWLLDRLPD